ncbi:MAG TPA: DUF305 domain-containing protein [Ilumatobacter sp.]|nr:DUF305 domain-containing protein [Ilumatobacter sp.]
MIDLETRPEAPDEIDDVDEVVSDETLRRILTGMLVTLSVVAVAVVFIAGARWATTDTAPEPFGTADIGFLQDMIDHHQQALLLANTYLDANPDGDAAAYARDVLISQEWEIARMDEWLTQAGSSRGAAGRTAMTWMGMPTPVDQMPGMQPDDRIAELAAARGADADRLFFAIMSDHHLGGVHMADAVTTEGRRSDLREFATKMSRNQRVEVVEYRQAVERLGL